MNGVVLKLKTQETIWLKIYLAFTSQFSALRLFSSQNNVLILMKVLEVQNFSNSH
jgi:hypothetical protein